MVDDHHGLPSTGLDIPPFRTRRHTSPYASCFAEYRSVLEAAGMRVERMPVPKPSTPGSYPYSSRESHWLESTQHDGSIHAPAGWTGREPSVVGDGHQPCCDLTLLLYANIHNLRTGTELTDLFGSRDPQWRAASEAGKELGYGNQLFVLIEVPNGEKDTTGQMEEAADRLTADMLTSGLFLDARCGLQEEELLNIVRYFTWNFPSFMGPEQTEDVKRRLDPKRIHQNVRRAATELVTPFSSLGTNYFIADPLGLMQVEARNSGGLSQFANFDLNWGSGNRFFSKDHKALLIIAEPRQSAMDYKFAEQVVHWTREHIQSMNADPAFHDAGVRATPAGAYVYAEQEHQFIEANIRRISTISIVGNLVLCLVIYPRIPLLLLSLLPAGLGILWTTGVASFYPGEVNLISLSFIAILAGLGDDQVVHFFNRVPQEWGKGGTLNDAVLRSFETTGFSVLLCIITAATATASLATSSFKALAEFGFILTVGMFMMVLHTLLTVPALMGLWWRISKPRAPETITFRSASVDSAEMRRFCGPARSPGCQFWRGNVRAVISVSADD